MARESTSSVVIRRSSGCSKQRQDRSPSIDGSRYFWRRKQMLFATVRLVRLWRRMCHFENAEMRDPAERVLWRLTLCSYGLRASHILDANRKVSRNSGTEFAPFSFRSCVKCASATQRDRLGGSWWQLWLFFTGVCTKTGTS